MNKKGFMLLETLIVSTILVGVLIFLYIQLINMKGSYEVSFKENTISGLYIAKEIAEYIYINDSIYNSLKNRLDNSEYGYVEITSFDVIFKDLFGNKKLSPGMKIQTIIFTDDNEKLDLFKNSLIQKLNISNNKDFKKFILKLYTSRTNYNRLFIEFQDKTYCSILVVNNENFSNYDASNIYYSHSEYTDGKLVPVNDVLDDMYNRIG